MRKVTLLVVLLSSLSILSCTKTKEVIKEVEKTYKWQEFRYFKGKYSVQMNSRVVGDYLYTQGPGSFHREHGRGLGWRTSPFPLTIRKMPISDQYHLYMDHNTHLIQSKNELFSSDVRFEMSDLDPSFFKLKYPDQLTREAIVTNNQHQALLAFATQEGNNRSMKLLLWDMKATEESGKLSGKQIIDVPESYPNTLKAVNDHFYLSGNNHITYRIAADGSLTQLNTGLLEDFVEHNGVIYGIAEKKIYTSKDNGLTWSLFAENDQTPYRPEWGFAKVDDKIIMYNLGRIGQVEFTSLGIEVKYLENDALADKQITSVCHRGDDVYVTTLSGVYTKKLAIFFEEEAK